MNLFPTLPDAHGDTERLASRLAVRRLCRSRAHSSTCSGRLSAAVVYGLRARNPWSWRAAVLVDVPHSCERWFPLHGSGSLT